MARQTQKKPSKKAETTEEAELARPSSVAESDELDDLLDEMDTAMGDLTDAEAADFVTSYVQKGGE